MKKVSLLVLAFGFLLHVPTVSALSCNRCSDTTDQRRVSWTENDGTCNYSNVVPGSTSYWTDFYCCKGSSETCPGGYACDTLSSNPSTNVNDFANYHTCKLKTNCNRCSDTSSKTRVQFVELDSTCDASQIVGSVSRSYDSGCCVSNSDCDPNFVCNTSVGHNNASYHVCQYVAPTTAPQPTAAPVDCSKCGSWTNVMCGGLCGVTQYQQSRTGVPDFAKPAYCFNPAQCSTYQCVSSGGACAPRSYYYLDPACGNQCLQTGTYNSVQDCNNALASKSIPGACLTSCPVATAIPIPTPTSCVRSDSNWAAWGACTKSCGGGTQSRSCIGQASCGGVDNCVPDPDGAERQCNKQACVWFQVDGGGVTANGIIRSPIPSTEVFVKNVPGVAAANKTIDLNGQPLSNSGNWQAANSNIDTSKDYYTEIRDRVLFGVTPNSFTGNFNGVPAADGYTYYQASGIVALPVQDFGNSKVVLLTEGDAIVTGNITVGAGGKFILLTKGDIRISNQVTNVQGIFLTQGVLSTGRSAVQLRLDGSFVGMRGVQLERTFEGAAAELFVFHPEYLTNLPKYMLRKNVIWNEVAP